MKLSEKQLIDALKYDPELVAQYRAIMQILDEEIEKLNDAATLNRLEPHDRSYNAGMAQALKDFRLEIVSFKDIVE